MSSKSILLARRAQLKPIKCGMRIEECGMQKHLKLVLFDLTTLSYCKAQPFVRRLPAGREVKRGKKDLGSFLSISSTDSKSSSYE